MIYWRTTHRWRHYYKPFPSVFSNGGKFWEFRLYFTWLGEGKYRKKSCRGCEQVRETGEKKEKHVSLKKMTQKKYSNSLSRARLNETQNGSWNDFKVRIKPLLCFEFNKPSKQDLYEINLFKKFNFSQFQNNWLHRLVSSLRTGFPFPKYSEGGDIRREACTHRPKSRLPPTRTPRRT